MDKNEEKMIEIGSFVTNASSGHIKTTVYMEAKAFDKNEVKKDLYKSKNMAKFSHYVSGNLYYNVELSVGVYQFPIATVEEREVIFDSVPSIKLSEDLGTTEFGNQIKGSELNRWISKAIDKGEFVKVG